MVDLHLNLALCLFDLLLKLFKHLLLFGGSVCISVLLRRLQIRSTDLSLVSNVKLVCSVRLPFGVECSHLRVPHALIVVAMRSK